MYRTHIFTYGYRAVLLLCLCASACAKYRAQGLSLATRFHSPMQPSCLTCLPEYIKTEGSSPVSDGGVSYHVEISGDIKGRAVVAGVLVLMSPYSLRSTCMRSTSTRTRYPPRGPLCVATPTSRGYHVSWPFSPYRHILGLPSPRPLMLPSWRARAWKAK